MESFESFFNLLCYLLRLLQAEKEQKLGGFLEKTEKQKIANLKEIDSVHHLK